MDDFAEFVRGCSPALLRTAYVLTGDRGHAEDLLQEVLARMHRRWRFITGPPQTYARRALVHAATSRWRWRNRRPAERAWGAGEDIPTPDDASDLVLAGEAVSVLLAELPVRQRAVIALRYLDDLSEIETAQLLGCSVGTVKSQASRGLARLRELLGANESVVRRTS
jgi:RNA polymerase sigma-70 factor (sigma-E family)